MYPQPLNKHVTLAYLPKRVSSVSTADEGKILVSEGISKFVSEASKFFVKYC